MGNETSNPIRNMDKRTARREYRDKFMAAIQDFQLENNANPDARSLSEEQMLAEMSKRDLNFDDYMDNPPNSREQDSRQHNNVRVVVRKRPIFQHEMDAHEFDVVSCLEGGGNVVVHDTRMHADMRRMLITNNAFSFDGVFHQRATNEVVYQSAAKPLVKEAVNGGFATVCVYGQTGSGKSFTMTSFYEKAAYEIFAELDNNNERMYEAPRISMSFFELQGETCLDLLNTFQPASLLTAGDGGVHAVPVVEPTVTSAEEMVALIRHALSIRSTSATGVHDASSRSHAILRIYVEQPQQPDTKSEGERMMMRDMGMGEKPEPREGVLTLVDLAGSEQSIDSMYHTAELRKEGAAINSSLMALKDCIRAKASGSNATHIYRKSKLTMALKESFVLPTARTVIVATVSPSSKDTEHSLNTLRHACLMDGQKKGSDDTEQRFITGGTKSETYQIGEVDVTSISRKNRELKKKGGSVDAKTSNGNYMGKDVSSKAGPVKKPPPELTEKQKAKARRMADRSGLARLPPSTKELLLAHRESLGNEIQQIRRMKRVVSPFLSQEGVGQNSDIRSQSPPPAPPGPYPGNGGSVQSIQNQNNQHRGENTGISVGYSTDPNEYDKYARALRASSNSPRFNGGSGEGGCDQGDGSVQSSIDSQGVPIRTRPLSARLTGHTAASASRSLIGADKKQHLELQRKQQQEAALLSDEEGDEYEDCTHEFDPPIPASEEVERDSSSCAHGDGYYDSATGEVTEDFRPVNSSQSNTVQNSPPRKPNNKTGIPQLPAEKSGGNVTVDDQGRTAYWKLYVRVYGKQVEHYDAEQKEVLNKQLLTLCRMHGYDDREISHLQSKGRPVIPQMRKKQPVIQNTNEISSNNHMEGGPPVSAPTRKSHMSSYGGAANTDGARNEVVHKSIQTNEQKKANLQRQPPNGRGQPNGLQTAAEKLAKEAKIREDRREKAKATKAKEEQLRMQARENNRADMLKMQQLQMQHASETVDNEAAKKEQRRQNALNIKNQRDLEHRQGALRRLQEKGFVENDNANVSGSGGGNVMNSPRDESFGQEYHLHQSPHKSPAQAQTYQSPPQTQGLAHGAVQNSPPPQLSDYDPPRVKSNPHKHATQRRVDTTEDDREIARITKLVINARYQPMEAQRKLKKQLADLKMNKTRKEKGEPPLAVEPTTNSSNGNSNGRPSSAGGQIQRPSSASYGQNAATRNSPRPTGGSNANNNPISPYEIRQSNSREESYTRPNGGAAGAASGMTARDHAREVAKKKLRLQHNSTGSRSSGQLNVEPNANGMPDQLRREVHEGSATMDTYNVNSPSNHQGGELGRSGVEALNMNAGQYSHRAKRHVQPAPSPRKEQTSEQQQQAPARRAPVQISPQRNANGSVHTEGRQPNGRGGYTIGASSAPFGNSYNE